MNEIGVKTSIDNRALTRSSQVLMGIVTGIVADGELNDREIQLLSTWLSENNAVTTVWPGSAIATLVREILSDGIVTTHERDHLLKSLQKMCGSSFVETGASTPETAALPYGALAHTSFTGLCLCLTGEFLYGTRASCEKLLAGVGATAADIVSKKVHYLVVGTHVSPSWVNTSYGRKIQRAMELREQGHGIVVIPEQHWLETIGK